MSLIEKIIDTTSSVLKDVDKVDIELTSNRGTDAILYSVLTEKSVSIRHQIKPKHKKNGTKEIKLKKCADVVEGIYSWCGFKWLCIKLELTVQATEDFQESETVTKSLHYSDVPPGWLFFSPLVFHPYMTITISFVEKIETPTDINCIQLKTITLEMGTRTKLQDALFPDNPIPHDYVQQSLEFANT